MFRRLNFIVDVIGLKDDEHPSFDLKHLPIIFFIILYYTLHFVSIIISHIINICLM